MSSSWLKDHYDLPVHPAISKFDPKEFLVGVELEIEAVKNPDACIGGNWKTECDIDHSLRNNGREFKFWPDTFESTIAHFEYLHSKLKTGDDPFSERTSVHVHVNCLNFDARQLRELVLMYALVEPLYLNFVGEKRTNSIFCVPLNFTTLPDSYKRDISHLIQVWHKYTAFNIMPLKQFGTIEFRHLYGTGDVKIFRTWLSAIRDLFLVIMNDPEFNLLSEFQKRTDPTDLAMKIVPTLAQNVPVKVLKELLKDSVLDVKLASGGFVK